MNTSSDKFYENNTEFLKILTKFVGDNYELKKENENLKNKLMEKMQMYNKECLNLMSITLPGRLLQT